MANENSNQNHQLLSAKMLAKNVLSVPPRAIEKLLSDGMLPKPLSIGGHQRWLSSEISAWLAAGVPDLETWVYMKAAAEGCNSD